MSKMIEDLNSDRSFWVGTNKEQFRSPGGLVCSELFRAVEILDSIRDLKDSCSKD